MTGRPTPGACLHLLPGRDRAPGPPAGPDADCDLCHITKGKFLELPLVTVPNNLKAPHRGAMSTQVLLQARSVEADSNLLSIELAWGRQRADGDTETAKHLVVKEVPLRH